MYQHQIVRVTDDKISTSLKHLFYVSSRLHPNITIYEGTHQKIFELCFNFCTVQNVRFLNKVFYKKTTFYIYL